MNKDSTYAERQGSPAQGTGFVGRFLSYPDLTGRRQAEGGRRLKGELRTSRPDRPLVTIITVCFNSARTIEQTFRSVRRQTYDNIEYVVVDGASSDDTLDIIRAHEDLIDYYVSEPDQGLYYAMNKGIELARGDYILVLNSDDWYARHAVEELVAAVTYSGCDFVSGRARHVDDGGQPGDVMRSMPYDASVYLRMPLRHETMLIPARIYDGLGGYDTRFRIISDYEFAIRLFESGYSAYEFPRALLFFRKSGVSHVDVEGVLRERKQLLGHYFPSLSEPDIDLLCDRGNHTGAQLMDLAERPSIDDRLREGIHCYVADNASNGLLGKGPRQWREHGGADLALVHGARLTRRPKVSVILAVYNAEQTLRACLDSILAQTLDEFELICVNDCSPDGSPAILDEYAARDRRIKVVKNEKNIGLGATRNHGIRSARGSYVFHIDPDDTIPADALEILYTTASKHGSELVRGAYLREQFHHDSKDFKPEIMLPLGHSRTLVNVTAVDVPDIVQMPEGHWAYLYDSRLARRVPYPRDLKMGQDAIFLVSALLAARSITVIPDVVYHYLENAKSAMNVFNFQKYLDVLEWRRRAYHMLKCTKLERLGVRFLRAYANLPWHDQFIRSCNGDPDQGQVERLGRALRAAYAQAGLPEMNPKAPEHRRTFLQLLLEDKTVAAIEAIKNVTVDVRHAPAQHAPESAGRSTPARDGAAPKISVILPIFNAESTLRRCLDSVLGQDLGDLEVICINDQTPDGSQAIVDEYAASDPRIVPMVNERNMGLGASRNRGVAAARGEYIFHVDPDDTVPPHALAGIYEHAVKYGSDMTRGAYIHEQLLNGSRNPRKVRKGLREGAPHIVNSTLARSPGHLKSTEGHWSYLYEAGFAKGVKYPEDLKMGQDSIFLVGAVLAARSISVTDTLVYHYRANAKSAMNTFNFRKFMDALEWRERAWRLLSSAGHGDVGDSLLFDYWSPQFFHDLDARLTDSERSAFDSKLECALRRAGYSRVATTRNPEVREYLASVMQAASSGPSARAGHGKPLRVATLTTQDHGGAGIGSMRRVRALRRHGAMAEVHALLKKSDEPFVHQVPVVGVGAGEDMRSAWKRVAVLTRDEHPGLGARELFSKTGALVDFQEMRQTFQDADIVHLHWVSGMFDYDGADVLADKPVAWTLADMNAFTGGCHYSQGCEGYREECRNCPLLEAGSTLAHEAWKVKKKAYSQLKNLTIICPSEWMAKKVRESSLLSGHTVHVIPNAFPIDQFAMTNKMVARMQLGLPLRDKLIMFGADSQTNKRKGGDLLAGALEILKETSSQKEDITIVTYGSNSMDFPFPARNLGYLVDPGVIALAYSACDVYAFPSREDNAPLTVAEALLCGTPTVAFPVGNVPDLVRHGENGYIARYGDTGDFAAGLDWAISTPAGRESLKRSVMCRVGAEKFHSPETAAARHVEVYRKMLDKSAM